MEKMLKGWSEHCLKCIVNHLREFTVRNILMLKKILIRKFVVELFMYVSDMSDQGLFFLCIF